MALVNYWVKSVMLVLIIALASSEILPLQDSASLNSEFKPGRRGPKYYKIIISASLWKSSPHKQKPSIYS